MLPKLGYPVHLYKVMLTTNVVSQCLTEVYMKGDGHGPSPKQNSQNTVGSLHAKCIQLHTKVTARKYQKAPTFDKDPHLVVTVQDSNNSFSHRIVTLVNIKNVPSKISTFSSEKHSLLLLHFWGSILQEKTNHLSLTGYVISHSLLLHPQFTLTLSR